MSPQCTYLGVFCTQTNILKLARLKSKKLTEESSLVQTNIHTRYVRFKSSQESTCCRLSAKTRGGNGPSAMGHPHWLLYSMIRVTIAVRAAGGRRAAGPGNPHLQLHNAQGQPGYLLTKLFRINNHLTGYGCDGAHQQVSVVKTIGTNVMCR